MLLMKSFIAAAFIMAAPSSAISAQDDAADTSISSTGNPDKGRRVFNRCKACHNISTSSRMRLGPNLNDLFGKQAGSAEGYRYSKAMEEADFIWTEAMLDKWLRAPNSFLPGNKMQFAGLRREQDRKDLIAYLRKASAPAE